MPLRKFPANSPKFDIVKALNLPIGQYAITASGPLGLRDLRLISDIDIIVDSKLWAQLSENYKTVQDHGDKKLVSDNLIDIIGSESILNPVSGAPTIAEQIASAEYIEGLAFVCLEYVLFFKERMGREKTKQTLFA